MKLPSDRFDFSRCRNAAQLTLPNSAAAIYTVVSVEEWDIQKPIVRQYVPALPGVTPVVQNWSWHEFGMRVGFWRILEALKTRNIRASAAVNARLADAYEPIARAMLDAGWEFIGHGVVQGPLTTAPDQRAVIRETRDLLRSYTGKNPKGWLGLDLAEAYLGDARFAGRGRLRICRRLVDGRSGRSTMRTKRGPTGGHALLA